MGEQYKDSDHIAMAELKRLLSKMRENDPSSGAININSTKKKPKATSSKTTKEERQAIRDHIAELDKQLNKKKETPKPINPFIVGQTVALDPYNQSKTGGKVLYIACKLALPSVQKCDKKDCKHAYRNYVWVSWNDGRVFSYRFSKLRLMSADELKPRIGKELSGRIGPWTFDAQTKLWKKDGDDKLYTENEFSDILYYEQHPHAKQEAADFLAQLKKESSFH